MALSALTLLITVDLNCLMSKGTVKLLIFVAINFHVLPMACHFVAINFCIYLACLMSFNISWRFSFAKTSASRISQNKIGLQYVAQKWTSNTQASLHIGTVLQELLLITHTTFGTRGSFVERGKTLYIFDIEWSSIGIRQITNHVVLRHLFLYISSDLFLQGSQSGQTEKENVFLDCFTAFWEVSGEQLRKHNHTVYLRLQDEVKKKLLNDNVTR